MKKYLHMILVLGIVGLVSGLSLVSIYRYATPLIEENQKKELEKAIFNIIPGAETYEAIGEGADSAFEVYGKGKKLIGYAFIAEGNGYQGKIKMIAGVKKDLATLYGIEILDSVETPGLGGEIANDSFKGQFKGLKFTPEIICVKGAKEKANEIEAITGATISSDSVTNILNERLARLSDIIKQ